MIRTLRTLRIHCGILCYRVMGVVQDGLTDLAESASDAVGRLNHAVTPPCAECGSTWTYADQDELRCGACEEQEHAARRHRQKLRRLARRTQALADEVGAHVDDDDGEVER